MRAPSWRSTCCCSGWISSLASSRPCRRGVYVPAYLPASLRTRIPAPLPSCLPASLPAYLSCSFICLPPTHPPVRLPACPPTYRVPACQAWVRQGGALIVSVPHPAEPEEPPERQVLRSPALTRPRAVRTLTPHPLHTYTHARPHILPPPHALSHSHTVPPPHTHTPPRHASRLPLGRRC